MLYINIHTYIFIYIYIYIYIYARDFSLSIIIETVILLKLFTMHLLKVCQNYF